MADLLEAQDADRFRVRAYRQAAQEVMRLREPIEVLWQTQGHSGLVSLPGIGETIAGAIGEMIETGRWTQLDYLRGEAAPEALFSTIPGVGPALAERIHEHLHVETLPALELAAHDGRLENVPGIGARRAAGIAAALAVRLGSRLRRTGKAVVAPPPVAMLLDVDREYRTRAAAGKLKTISPKRFNPKGEAWLPILHTTRSPWSFTALFSNTARAHDLGRTRDWVVIFYHRDGTPEDQCTVVTARQGVLKGKRVIRGRESEQLLLEREPKLH